MNKVKRNKKGFVVNHIWAYLMVDPRDNDTEGVASFKNGECSFPMIGADKARMKSLRPYALELRSRMNSPLRLVKFTARELIEEL